MIIMKMSFIPKFMILGMLIGIGIMSCSSSGGGRGSDEDGDSIHVDTLQKYPTSGEIKVMSFNVRYETSEAVATNNWDFRKEACVDMIKDQEPTVIGFQEAVYTSQWAYLKEQLAGDYDGFGVGRDDGATKGECMGILYRKDDVEKIDGGTFWLSDTPDIPSKLGEAVCYRTATWGIFKIKNTGQVFFYLNTHLDTEASARQVEMNVIIKKLIQYNPNGYPQFVSADFNASENDSRINNIYNELKKIMENVRDYASRTDYTPTFEGFGNGSTGEGDYIFCSKILKPVEYHVVVQSYDSRQYLSDHYPIYGIIKF